MKKLSRPKKVVTALACLSAAAHMVLTPHHAKAAPPLFQTVKGDYSISYKQQVENGPNHLHVLKGGQEVAHIRIDCATTQLRAKILHENPQEIDRFTCSKHIENDEEKITVSVTREKNGDKETNRYGYEIPGFILVFYSELEKPSNLVCDANVMKPKEEINAKIPTFIKMADKIYAHTPELK